MTRVSRDVHRIYVLVVTVVILHQQKNVNIILAWPHHDDRVGWYEERGPHAGLHMRAQQIAELTPVAETAPSRVNAADAERFMKQRKSRYALGVAITNCRKLRRGPVKGPFNNLLYDYGTWNEAAHLI